MPKRKNIVWIILLLIIGSSIFYWVKIKKTKTEYTTETAVRGDLFQTVSVTGAVKAKKETNLSFKKSGQLTKMLFEVGDEVKKGAKLAEIDKGALYFELQQAQEDLEAQSETLDHMKDKDDVYSDEQIDAQKAVVRKYEQQINVVKQAISETVMYAPIDGKIIRKNYNVGENVMANAVVYVIAGKEGIEIEADIPESDVVQVKVGQKAAVKFDALSSDEELEAEVVQIDPAATEIQDVVYYKAKLYLIKEDERLKNGMTADVDIRTAEKNKVVMIPLRAIKEEGNRKYVEVLKVVNKVEAVEKVFIETGLKGDEGMVEVLSGLAGGEKVIIFSKTE